MVEGGPGPTKITNSTVQEALSAARRGRSVAVTGPPASGVSTVLRQFVAEAADLPIIFDPAAAASEARPGAVLVVDDAQLLDARLVDELAQRLLAGELTVVLGTTVRSATLSRLRSAGALLSFELTPVDDNAIAQLVLDTAGAVPDGATTRALAADSARLPGVLVPTVQAAVADGSLAISAGIVRLRGVLPSPAPVVDRIVRVRTALSGPADAVLEAVCVGRELPAGPAIEAFGLDALAEAEQVAVISVDEEDRVVRPGSGAIARAVRAELGTFGVARVARALTEAMPDAPTERRVHWHLLAGDEPTSSELVEAAAAAQQRGDLAVALDLAARARRDGDARGALLFAEMTSAVGDRVGSAVVLEQLLDEPDVAAELRAGAALELATLNLWNLGRPDRAIALAEDVASLTEGTPFEGVGKGALGAMFSYTGRGVEALATVEPYLEQNVLGRMLSCQVATTSLSVRGAGDRAVSIGEQGLALSQEKPGGPGDLDPEIHVVSLALALELSGRLQAAEGLTDEWYERAASRSVHHAWIALARSRIMLARGDLTRASLYAREAAAIFGDLDNHAPRRWAVAAHLLAAAQQGDTATVQVRLNELELLGASGVTFLDVEVERARTWADATLGHLDRARDHMASVAAHAEDGELFALAANAWHDVLRLNGNNGAAARLVALEGKVDGALMTARVLHAAATADGDIEGLIRAGRAYADVGASLFGAEAAAQARTAAERRHERNQTRSATALLRELRADCADAATPLLRNVPIAELSPRERDVAHLAASGLTSRQISERLDLSVRTIDNLLQRVYVKLGVGGRRDLAEVIDGSSD